MITYWQRLPWPFDRGQLETAENLAERFLRNTPEQSRLMIPSGLEFLTSVQVELDKKNAAEKVVASASETFRELGALPGQKWSESILRKIKNKNRDHSDKSNPDAFTKRELEILCEVARGKSNPEIASDHFISIRTVERHISNIYSKLGVSGRAARAAATAYAHKNNLLD